MLVFRGEGHGRDAHATSMSDPSKDNLSEISHLFLSSVRDKAKGLVG